MCLPSFKWFADAWLSDAQLRSCSLAARGLWADLLSLMHKNDRRGYLEVNVEEIAREINAKPEEVRVAMEELIAAGVPSRDKSAIYSRRMVRDEIKRIACCKAGQKGGGNPVLTKKPRAPTPSKNGHATPPTTTEPDGFDEFWAAYPRKEGKKPAKDIWARLKPDKELQAKIIEAIGKQAKSSQWLRGFVPHANTWLNQRRWADELFEPASAAAKEGMLGKILQEKGIR